eukprot:scaffold291823_cov33-Tisochrysis_lutea.AAC.2
MGAGRGEVGKGHAVDDAVTCHPSVLLPSPTQTPAYPPLLSARRTWHVKWATHALAVDDVPEKLPRKKRHASSHL